MTREPPENRDGAGAASGGRPDERPDERRLELLDGEASLLDAVDGLLNQGVSVTGDVVLGLADVDLVYLRLSALLAAADRIFGRGGEGGAPAPPGPAAPPPGREPESDPEPAPGPGTKPGPGAEPEAAGGGGAGDAGGPEPGTRAERAAAPAAPRVEAADLDSLRGEVEEGLTGSGAGSAPARWNAEPDDVERSVAKLVLTLVELIRQLLERQSIRRMEEETLTEDEVERIGRALMRLERTVADMARRFGLDPEDLNLDLGPLGRLI